MVYAPPRLLENETHKILWDFVMQTDHQISARRPDLVLINKKKRICHLVDFSVSIDSSENKKRKQNDKLIPESRQNLKKLRNMKVMVIPIVVGVLGTISKNLGKKIEMKIRERIETIETTALLKSVRILSKSPQVSKTLLSLRLQEKTLS